MTLTFVYIHKDLKCFFLHFIHYIFIKHLSFARFGVGSRVCEEEWKTRMEWSLNLLIRTMRRLYERQITSFHPDLQAQNLQRWGPRRKRWCLCFYSFSNEPNPQDWKPVCCWRRKLLRVGWEEERQSENLLWEDLDGPKWGRQGKRGTKLVIGKREDVFLLLLD